MKKLSWDGLRYFLAVARRGSASGAARDLGTSVPTISRRIQDLESALGARLLDRNTVRQTPTAAGEALYAYAERVEAVILEAEDRLRGQDERPRGTLRVAIAEVVAHTTLLPRLRDFRDRFAEIRLELLIGPGSVRLGWREADVAIRLRRPSSGDYTVRALGTVRFAWYRVKGAPANGGTPIGWDRQLDPAAMPGGTEGSTAGAQPSITIDTATGQWLAVRNGVGPCLLACAVADRDAALERSAAPDMDVVRRIWLVTRRAVAGTARARAFADFVETACATDAERLSGVTVDKAK